MTIKKNIPNLITLGNLLCGVLASYFAIMCHFRIAALLICLGIVLDFFDGLSARLLKVSSPLGKELDSLADLVTSGIAPAFIAFQFLEVFVVPATSEPAHWFSFLVMLMPLFAAYRLAKFNLDEEQHHSFKGLPVPANALFWLGFAFMLPESYSIGGQWWTPVIIIVSIILDILMVSNLPMFSLKFNFKDLSWRTNKTRYIFLIGCAVITLTMILVEWHFNECSPIDETHISWLALSLSIVWYIILSIIKRKETKSQINN